MDHPSPSARSGGGGGGGGGNGNGSPAATRRERPAGEPDVVSDESSASSMSDEEDADDVGAGYRPQTPTPPPQRRQQRQQQQQQQQQQQYSPPQHPPPTRGSREKDIRAERRRERDRDRDRPRDRDRDRDKDRDRDREPEFKRGGPPSPPLDRDRDRDRDSPPTPRDVKRQSFAVDDKHYNSGYGGGSSAHHNGHARRRQQSVPPNSANNGAKRQSITERLMSTWTARTAKEPVAAAAPSAMTSSRRASSASTTASKFNPMGRVREWLDTCNAEHGGHCSSPPGDTWRPIWLIDSVNRCLVRARATDRYIALSYVYEPPLPSSRGPVETLRGNLEMLTASMDDADIPQTILDAMWLARKLGIKYLWVDRFCIVQDDDVEREEHVKNMAYVYANAYLTIVAAMGDAETGLTGLLRRTPPPRGAASRKHDDLVLSSRWAGRAWTVQEGMYSRRKVYVFEETVTWECHCDVWQGSPAGGGGRFSKILKGGGRSGPCLQRTLPAATGFLHPVWPDMDEYARIAMEFSARRVTLMSDTTRALRGITTVLSRSFAGGFIFGMPVSFLDVAMLWQPRAMVRRRMMVQPMTGMNPLPSWSWLGWHYDGVPADLTLWRAAADYVQEAPPSGRRGGAERRFKSPYAFRLRSLVSYELTDRATYTPLPNDGMAYRDRRHRRTVPLPAGWSRSNGGFRYAGDPEVVFRYPVPVAEMAGGGDGGDGGGAVGGGSPYGDFAMNATLLSFSTTMAFLEVDFATARNGAPVDAKAANAVNTGNNTGPAAGLVAPGRGYGVPLAIGNIWSRTGKWCGVVTAHDSWLGLQGANHTGEERLEFVAVSMASERGGSHVFDLDAFRDNMDEDEIVDFVNVLWVERVGGVCYRRGLGHVVQRVWDAAARDRVEVLLG